MRFYALFAFMFLLAISGFAADVDGKWAGTVSTPNGDFPVTFKFKAEESKLTGTMVDMQGADIPIADGKIDGNNISFSVSLDFGGTPFKLTYKGVVSPDQIKLSGDAGGESFEYTVKKAN